jgi:glycogen debranching enzyme
VNYYGWVKEHRRRPNGLYWNTGLGSGEDDLTRSYVADSWVDMTAQQAQSAYYIARIAEAAGDKSTAAYFDGENKLLGAQINAKMWDQQAGFYYDLKKDGSFTGIKTALGFWPLLAHIATQEQAAALVAHLQNPREFWRPNLVPALAADEPGYTPEGQYWNGAVWAPTNVMVVKGLQDYGYEDLAAQVTEVYLSNMAKVFDSTGTIWENYAPEHPQGHGVRDMVGWSGDGPIALLIENVLGVRPVAAEHRVSWRPRLPGINGLRDLVVGKVRLSLIAGRLTNGRRTLAMQSDGRIDVTVDTGVGRQRVFHLKGGTLEAAVPAKSLALP